MVSQDNISNVPLKLDKGVTCQHPLLPSRFFFKTYQTSGANTTTSVRKLHSLPVRRQTLTAPMLLNTCKLIRCEKGDNGRGGENKEAVEVSMLIGQSSSCHIKDALLRRSLHLCPCSTAISETLASQLTPADNKSFGTTQLTDDLF